MIVAIVAMIAPSVSEVLTLTEASLVAVAGLLGTKVISPNEARRAVNLNVVMTIALSVSLGGAVSSSGLAAEIAEVLGAVATATANGLDPRSMALVVLIGASCSFLSPIGYQTNLMVYSVGGYRFADFTRLGAPITLATLVLTPLVLPLAIPLR